MLRVLFALSLISVVLIEPAYARNQGMPATASGSAPSGIRWNDNTQRNVDDRQLNTFATEFMGIDKKAKDAPAHLRDLANHVEAFHQALFTRNYNAMDILKDTENLQKRVAAEQAKLPPPPPPKESGKVVRVQPRPSAPPSLGAPQPLGVQPPMAPQPLVPPPAGIPPPPPQ